MAETSSDPEIEESRIVITSEECAASSIPPDLAPWEPPDVAIDLGNALRRTGEIMILPVVGGLAIYTASRKFASARRKQTRSSTQPPPSLLEAIEIEPVEPRSPIETDHEAMAKLANEEDVMGELAKQEEESEESAKRRAERRRREITDAIELEEDRTGRGERSLEGDFGHSPVEHYYRYRALEQAYKHARKYPNREVGGVLLGVIRRFKQGRIITIVTSIIRADGAIGRQASLRFTPEAWAEVLGIRDRDPIYQDEVRWQIVGWYHTHPNFGIFLSSMDVHTHRTFTDPGHIALVIDPVRNKYGTFGWNDDMSGPVRLVDESRTSQGVLLTDKLTLDYLNRLNMGLEDLPPVELPAHYPRPAKTTLEKARADDDFVPGPLVSPSLSQSPSDDESAPPSQRSDDQEVETNHRGHLPKETDE